MNERVFEIREYYGMSQEAFGRKLGITRAAVSKIEAGKSNLTESNIKLICSEFDISENWLRTGEGDILEPVTKDEKFASLAGQIIGSDNELLKCQIAMMAEIMLDFSDKEWKVVEKYIKEMATIIDARNK